MIPAWYLPSGLSFWGTGPFVETERSTPEWGATIGFDFRP